MNWRRTKKAFRKLQEGRPLTQKEWKTCIKFARKSFRKIAQYTSRWLPEVVVKITEVCEKLRDVFSAASKENVEGAEESGGVKKG